ncbi:hypothetical protein B7463_g1366, partial [Scytalidium lignicola]
MSTLSDSNAAEDPLATSTNLADSLGVRPSPAVDSSSNGGSAGGAPDKTDKTISCVNCRKRKLKCDRVKPSCATCLRAKQPCEYPERKRNVGSKRRNMRELEARLGSQKVLRFAGKQKLTQFDIAQVETKLVSEVNKRKDRGVSSAAQASQPPPGLNTVSMDFEIENNQTIDPLNLADNSPLPPFNIHAYGPTHPFQDIYSQELTSLGVEEPLPPVEMFEELNQIYFAHSHLSAPIIHKSRYLCALKLPPSMRPPVCLQYAVLATAAMISDKYSNYHRIFYERARKYLEATEMKGGGELYTSVRYVQAWHIIANYEAKQTYFARAWMSTGRCTRLSQMLGLHNLDSDYPNYKTMVPPPRDWIDKEERRRAFWSAFYGDRWASSGTGWPMLIDESGIHTNLPASEQAFENGIEEKTPSLAEALTPEGASALSPYAGVILSACLFGHNFLHLQRTGPDEHPEDLVRGEFWKRHRRMDNVLSNTFMFIPEHLRLPQGIRDMNVVFLNMNIHTSTICLHQAAVLAAQKHNLDSKFIRQCQERNLMAAEEITNIMRLVTHLNAVEMPSWLGFCLYVASGVFIQDEVSTHSRPQSKSNVDFLLSAMKAMGKSHVIAQHFLAQLEFDLEASGIRLQTNLREGNVPKPHMRVLRGVLPEGIITGDVHEPTGCSWSTSVFARDLAISAKTPKDDTRRSIHPLRMAGIWPEDTTSSSPDDSSGSSVNTINTINTINTGNQTMQSTTRERSSTEVLDTPIMDVTNDMEFANNSTRREFPYRETVSDTSHDRGTAGLYGMFQEDTSAYNVDIGWSAITAVQGEIPGSAAFSDISPQLREEDITAILEQAGWPANNDGKQ